MCESLIVGLAGFTFIPLSHEYIDTFWHQFLAKIVFIVVNVIINSVLTAPPSEVYAFRTLTFYATIFHHYDCLIETNKDEIDFYYKWLKNKYCLDFVKQFVYTNQEHGIRINEKVCDRITFNNLNHLIGILRFDI